MTSLLFTHRYTNDQQAPLGLAVGLFSQRWHFQFPHLYSRRRSTLHRCEGLNTQAMYRNKGCPGETDLVFFWSKFTVTTLFYFMNILHKKDRHVGYLNSLDLLVKRFRYSLTWGFVCAKKGCKQKLSWGKKKVPALTNEVNLLIIKSSDIPRTNKII